MEVLIEPRKCPMCPEGTVRFRASVIQPVSVDNVIRGTCDKCGKVYEQPLVIKQSEDLIPLDDE